MQVTRKLYNPSKHEANTVDTPVDLSWSSNRSSPFWVGIKAQAHMCTCSRVFLSGFNPWHHSSLESTQMRTDSSKSLSASGIAIQGQVCSSFSGDTALVLAYISFMKLRQGQSQKKGKPATGHRNLGQWPALTFHIK